MGLDFAARCVEAHHEVQMWRPRATTGKPCPIGQGIVPRISDWKPWVNWADLIVLTGNSGYREDFQRLIDKGYPVFGPNNEGAQLELDRAKGQEVLEQAGIETAPYQTFKNLDDAMAYVKKENRGFAIKPWGGTADKALSCIAPTPKQALHCLQDWKNQRIKGELMVQELVQGTEMGVSGWFGSDGWSAAIEEDWEEKKLMNDGLGPNTGEQGTIVRYVTKSKLFDKMLDPITEYLHSISYVGSINVNCIIDDKGQAWPLEFTTRLGWPAFCIHMALQQGDPAQWMLDKLGGKDTLKVSSDVAVGVVITHGNYPARTPDQHSLGKPIWGITRHTRPHIHPQHMMTGVGPGDDLKDHSMPVTAGDYIMVVTGTGDTVNEARKKAYDVAWQVELPTSKMFRTDLGVRLKKELPLLQTHGYATGLEY